MRTPVSILAVVGAALCLLLSAPAFADLVILDDCRRLEGETKINGSELILSGPFGKLRIPRKQVWKVIPQETPWAKFDRSFKAIAADNAAAFTELGTWAKSVGLKQQSVKAFEAAVSADADNATARAALGYEKIAGNWLRDEELLKAKGWVKFDDIWYTPEEFRDMKKTPAAEAKAWVEKVHGLLDSGEDNDWEQGISMIRKLGPNRSRVFFLKGLSDPKHPRLRLAAATALRDYGKKPEIVNALLLRSLSEGNADVRPAVLASLRELDTPGIVHTYNRALYAPDQTVRDRALECIDYFRFKESLPHLINVIEVHEIYGGRGASYIEVSRIESYIADYEGLIATQAAILDPVIKEFRTGSILWVQVKVVEIIRRIAGVDLGNDPEAWRKWMRSYIL